MSPTSAPARKKPAASRKKAAASRKKAPPVADGPQRVIDELETVRDRVEEFVVDLRERVEHDAKDWQASFEDAGAEALRDVAVRFVRVQRDPATLKAIAAAARERQAELRAAK